MTKGTYPWTFATCVLMKCLNFYPQVFKSLTWILLF